MKKHFEEKGHLETYGSDLNKLKRIDKRKIWTVVEEDDKLLVIAGIRLVNRLYYMVTNEKWKSRDEVYLLCEI